jgi:hypothetical protein
MFVPFNSISPSSRIWIYQSDRKLTADEIAFAGEFLTEHCNQWNAHGQPLRASFEIRFDQFIIIAADESYNSTSGCSVDDSVRAIKEIQQRLGMDFFNRNLIGFLKEQHAMLLPLANLKENYLKGIWNESTFTFNNLISTKNQLDAEWIVPAANTWLKRYVPQQTIKT